MKLGIIVPYHAVGPVAPAMLRLLVESIHQHIGRSEYEVLVIVNDCSGTIPENDQYLDYLECHEGVVVYALGPPRRPYLHRKDGDETQPVSYGHAVGIMAGFSKLRQYGCTHAWVIDADCVVLRPGFLTDAKRLFEYDRVAVVTDYFAGRPPDVGVDAIVDDLVEVAVNHNSGITHVTQRADYRCKSAHTLYGFPVLFCALVDLTVEERFGLMMTAGWVNSRWGQRLFRQGYRVGYFPFFQDRCVFHLGHGFTRFNAETPDYPFGNLVETARYGGKTTGTYHAGYLQLSRLSEEYTSWLLEESQSRPFENPISFDCSWLIEPVYVPLHGRGETYLRPFRDDDFLTLREIDNDIEATRFLTWGPHSEQETKVFLDHAIQHPHRWLVLADGVTERLIGYGELKPRDDSAVDLTYVIRPSLRGQGYAPRLIRALVEFAYSIAEYDQFWCAIDVEHGASYRALHKTGQPWIQEYTESYTLKERQCRRNWFCYRVGPIQPPRPSSDPDECHRDRELYLFDQLGVWR